MAGLWMSRTPPLIKRILAMGTWRNPPIVIPLPDGSGRHMVLDGANRTAALQKMGYARALHVNYLLAELAADKPLEEKNTEIKAWMQERLARKGVRYYTEATYLFDE